MLQSARTDGPTLEARRAESGEGFLERGSEPPPHQVGGLGSAGKFGIWCILRLENRIKTVYNGNF